MGNLGLSVLEDVVKMVLWGEVLELDSLVTGDDSVEQGLSALIFSGVLSVGAAGQVPGGNLGCTG